MVKFAKKNEEKEIAYVSSARSINYDKRQNKIERAKEKAKRGKSKKQVRKEHYEKINKKLGGTLTPRKKHTPKNVPRIKKKIKKKMIELAEDVDDANEIRRRLAAGEDIPRGRQNTAMGYAYERKIRDLNRTRKSLEKGEEVEDWALRQYNKELMKSIGRTIRKP